MNVSKTPMSLWIGSSKVFDSNVLTLIPCKLHMKLAQMALFNKMMGLNDHRKEHYEKPSNMLEAAVMRRSVEGKRISVPGILARFVVICLRRSEMILMWTVVG